MVRGSDPRPRDNLAEGGSNRDGMRSGATQPSRPAFFFSAGPEAADHPDPPRRPRLRSVVVRTSAPVRASGGVQRGKGSGRRPSIRSFWAGSIRFHSFPAFHPFHVKRIRTPRNETKRNESSTRPRWGAARAWSSRDHFFAFRCALRATNPAPRAMKCNETNRGVVGPGGCGAGGLDWGVAALNCAAPPVKIAARRGGRGRAPSSARGAAPERPL